MRLVLQADYCGDEDRIEMVVGVRSLTFSEEDVHWMMNRGELTAYVACLMVATRDVGEVRFGAMVLGA